MTATTPPMTAWYVLEVDGTGLASAQAAEREKAEREREREEGVLRSPPCATGCGSPRASPGAPGRQGCIQLDPGAVEVKRGQEQSQGGSSGHGCRGALEG